MEKCNFCGKEGNIDFLGMCLDCSYSQGEEELE